MESAKKTSDINHAKNFVKKDDHFFELYSPSIFLENGFISSYLIPANPYEMGLFLYPAFFALQLPARYFCKLGGNWAGFCFLLQRVNWYAHGALEAVYRGSGIKYRLPTFKPPQTGYTLHSGRSKRRQ